MEGQRKYAYRYLLYWAMLDIRPLAWNRSGWNPLHWRRDRARIRMAGEIADWLHNLAHFSALDFERFDEEWFWREFARLQSRFPDDGLDRYRQRFEELAGFQPQSTRLPTCPNA